MPKLTPPFGALATSCTLVLAGCGLQADNLGNQAAEATPSELVASENFFDTSQYKGPISGDPNRVMVLGTAHLRGLPDAFDPMGLGPLIDRLAAWEPDRIAVENQPGTLCEYMRTFPSRHASTHDTYCFDPTRAGEITGMSVPEAVAEMDQELSEWIGSPNPAQRRELVALALSAGDQASAMMHWLALPETERLASAELDSELVTIVEDLVDRGGEVALIAAPLAARLGHDAVIAIDHQATHIARPAALNREDEGEAIAAAWDNEACAERLPAYNDAMSGTSSVEGVEAMYRLLNRPDQAELAFRCDWGAAMNEPSGGEYGRRYLAYWETRNLRMAANIREAMGADPGSKTLVIVGASHKPYLDHYLDQMHDVEVISTDVVLPE